MTIIQLSAWRPEAGYAARRSGADGQSFRASRAGAALLAALDAASGEAPAALHTVAACRLREALAAPHLLSGLGWPQAVVAGPARLTLAETRHYRIFARRWQPGQFGPLRRMMDWFAYGVAEGRLVQLDYPDGQAPGALTGPAALRSATGQTALAAGQLRHGAAEGAGLRRFANLSASVALSLHIEGLPQPVEAAEPMHMPVPWVEAQILRRQPKLTIVSCR
ncbi:cupin domain-containing protein [Acidisoma sp. 7E03]